MIAFEQLPYRPCVGVVLVNREGLVFLGQRQGGPEHVDAHHSWQMPQGGIDEGEKPEDAALRELYEETSVTSVSFLGQSAEWLAYDLPEPIAREAWKGRYRGQKQKWIALRFTGEDTEINVTRPGGGKHKPEFINWRWERLDRTPSLIIPFKRPVYEQVAREFEPLVTSAGQ
ncbi:RNA pyrophosphohydrolase [Ancylobacter pratisalsi]|uniref:RNA pyrophosphohydrolase n=1 Tax=Ancylobacter pratisalsi TaxID=1745854 RepID=A0A6P1YN16_9HYPH|nr:RNA pyrophosphohydrolase [Ancylobacter pratisalsi]QIB34096.1 RNA pyrophosphohydrolase [Ancylobacter pratisalsi]